MFKENSEIDNFADVVYFAASIHFRYATMFSNEVLPFQSFIPSNFNVEKMNDLHLVVVNRPTIPTMEGICDVQSKESLKWPEQDSNLEFFLENLPLGWIVQGEDIFADGIVRVTYKSKKGTSYSKYIRRILCYKSCYYFSKFRI
jgi:hypothetical protein